MALRKIRTVVGYMDMVDFDHELGCALGGNTVYPSADDLRDNRRCHPQCGIVKVAVQFLEVIQEQNLDAEIEETEPPQKG